MREVRNFRLLIWQKSYQGAAFGPIRGPIGSLTNFGPLWVLLLPSAGFYAHGLTFNKNAVITCIFEIRIFLLKKPKNPFLR